MENLLAEIYNTLIMIVKSSSIYGPLFACFLIFVESILPVLPLFVFITIIFIAYGYVLGFFIAYILTCLGCIFSFIMCRKFFKNFFEKKIRKIENFDKLMKKIDKFEFTYLVLLIAIPFTPAFLINITASLSKMNIKKFILSIMIGKISLVFFWGFIGTSLLESLRNPKILLIIIIILLIMYFISKFITNKLDIK